jgi:hypothetical protein
MGRKEMSEIVLCGCGKASRLSNLLVDGACCHCGYSDDQIEVEFISKQKRQPDVPLVEKNGE